MTSAGPAAPPTPPPRWLQLGALGCVGLVLVAALAGAVIFLVVQRATAGPERVVQDFLAAAGAEDWQAAYGFFSAPLQEAQSFEAFAAAAAANAHLFKVRETTFSSRQVDLSGAQLAGSLTLESGEQVPASFGLVETDGGYLLVAYQIGDQ